MEPNLESEIEKGASAYSIAWYKVKTAPNITVKPKEILEEEKLPFIIWWWHQVTVTPEERSRMVFNRGILIGLKAVIV